MDKINPLNSMPVARAILKGDCSCSRAVTGSQPIRVKVHTGRILVEDDIYPEHEVEWMPARFHTWTKSYHCPAGDGSMEREMTLAIVEMQDGSVQYHEPHNIRFENTEIGRGDSR